MRDYDLVKGRGNKKGNRLSLLPCNKALLLKASLDNPLQEGIMAEKGIALGEGKRRRRAARRERMGGSESTLRETMLPRILRIERKADSLHGPDSPDALLHFLENAYRQGIRIASSAVLNSEGIKSPGLRKKVNLIAQNYAQVLALKEFGQAYPKFFDAKTREMLADSSGITLSQLQYELGTRGRNPNAILQGLNDGIMSVGKVIDDFRDERDALRERMRKTSDAHSRRFGMVRVKDLPKNIEAVSRNVVITDAAAVAAEAMTKIRLNPKNEAHRETRAAAHNAIKRYANLDFDLGSRKLNKAEAAALAKRRNAAMGGAMSAIREAAGEKKAQRFHDLFTRGLRTRRGLHKEIARGAK